MSTKLLFAGFWLAFVSLAITGCGDAKDASPAEETTGMTKKGDTSLPTSAEDLQQLSASESGTYNYSVEDFFRNPDQTSYQISPEGDYFSYLSPYESRMNIFVQKIGDTAAVRVTAETDRDIAGYFWGNNNRLVFIKDAGGDENFKLFAVNRDGSSPKDLTPYDSVTIQIIDDLQDREDELIIGMNKRNKMLFEPYLLNISSGEVTLLAENTDPMNPIVSWITDHEGVIRGAIAMSNGVEQNLMYRDAGGQPFKTVLTTNFKESVNPLFFDFENKHIYASSNLNRDKSAIVTFDIANGKEMEVLFEHPLVDVSGLSFSRKRKVLTTISYTTDKRQMKFLDKEAEAIYGRLRSALAGYEVVIASANKDEDKFLVRTYSDRSLGGYYFYDRGSDQISKITDVSPWLNEGDMASMKPIQYATRDGLTIYGYLTLPNGVDPVGLPVVVNPHGGPWARDSWGYNPEVQLLASRGYAVLQMNFRGSVGYGRAFWEASFKEWGKTMQDDITDGVKWLVEQGIADPERIAIYGGSYGGYATLAGVAFTPDLYTCAIDYVGVSNLFTFMKTIPPYWKPYLDMMYEMVGNPNTEDSLRMREASPVFHIDNIKSPLLVVQGANDPRVNIDESDQIVKALRDNGVEVPYLVKYDEGHGFRNEENKIEFYKVMLGFLAKHMHQEPAKG